MRNLPPDETALAERECDEVPPTRLVQRREMLGNKADGVKTAVQPRRTRTRSQSKDC